ncbi:MAG: hypothetical protein SFW67_32360 [Myxococcaceae bacterium]|nr:hypothetical protein [Myxococcaceae bacterium]
MGVGGLGKLGAVVAVVACTTHCQCFVPVDDPVDAGALDSGLVDAGVHDGGSTDGGARDAGVECESPADCQGPSWVSRWCLFSAPDAGFSCVANRCVAVCQDVSGDTCRVDGSGECLGCTRDGTLCPGGRCQNDAFSLRISSVECRPGVTAPLSVDEQLTFASVRGGACLMAITGDDGGVGFVTRSELGGPFFSWNLPVLGGWCVSHQLPTGALRSSVACPLCTFVIEGL